MLGQHARDVQAHVAHADDRHLAGGQVPGARVVGVSVVPGHEVGAAVGLRGVDAGDVEGCVSVRAGGEDEGVVVLVELGHRDVAADLHVADEPDVPALQDLVQRHDDLLDARVVRGHAVAHQAVGSRQALEQVDAHVQPGLGQDVGSVDTGGAGTDDGY